MELSDEIIIPGNRTEVFAKLIDPTILKYLAKAETGGKIAQLGSRLITSTARKLAKAFFQSFEEIMNENN